MARVIYKAFKNENGFYALYRKGYALVFSPSTQGFKRIGNEWGHYDDSKDMVNHLTKREMSFEYAGTSKEKEYPGIGGTYKKIDYIPMGIKSQLK